jgi:hypothetical protein
MGDRRYSGLTESAEPPIVIIRKVADFRHMRVSDSVLHCQIHVCTADLFANKVI